MSDERTRPASDPRPGADPRPDPGPDPGTRPGPELTTDETLRYARHLVLPEVGEEGQRRLKAARVLLVGAGGLGSPLGLYLAAAGVGTLGVVDDDVVDASNLQRQVVHGTSDLGRPKVESARERLLDVNPHVEVRMHRTRLDSSNALEILEPYDVVVDGTDNFPTRYLVNDACVLLGRPNVYGSVFRWEGQVSVFAAEDGPCYRCLFREPPPPGLVPTCAEGGVLGVVPGIVGTLQALETIKLLLDSGDPLIGRLLLLDAMEMRFREVEVRQNPECPVCGDEPTVTELIDYERFCGLEGGMAEEGTSERAAVPEGASGSVGAGARDDAAAGEGRALPDIGPEELLGRLEAGGPSAPVVVDVREPWEWRLGNLEERGARLIPLGELEERMDEIPTDREVVVLCRSGGRSAQAVERLREAGHPSVRNLRGGMLGWREVVDPSLPEY